MGWNSVEYEAVRELMQPGDVIAFGGNCAVSRLFKFISRSCVSHAGVILQSKLMIANTPQEGFFNQIIESTDFNGVLGVQINRLSTVLAAYDGNIWWLPLSGEIREKLDLKKFYDFLIHQDGKPFDIADAAELMCSTFFHRDPDITEDYAKFFCSELVVAGLEAGGALPPVDSSDVTPGDLCRCQLYAGDYYQLKGEKEEIKRYNTLDPRIFN